MNSPQNNTEYTLKGISRFKNAYRIAKVFLKRIKESKINVILGGFKGKKVENK